VEVAYRYDRTGALAAWSVHPVDRAEAGIPGATTPPDDALPSVQVVDATPERVCLDVAGVRADFAVHRVDDVSYVDSTDGSVTLTELPRFPLPSPRHGSLDDESPRDLPGYHHEGALVAPLPGAVGRIAVLPGQRVAAGDLLLTLEAMKLEHPVYAPGDGVVSSIPVQTGVQVDAGTLLAVITPD
jgi:propionyl-CoA carboxylase alpha chain